jgi:hypothetical protein
LKGKFHHEQTFRFLCAVADGNNSIMANQPMPLRYLFAGFFGLLGLAAAGLAIEIHAIEASSSWLFVVFAVFFLALAVVCAARLTIPAKPAKIKQPTSTKFVPAWFFDGAILAMIVFWGVVIVIYLLNKFYFHTR